MTADGLRYPLDLSIPVDADALNDAIQERRDRTEALSAEIAALSTEAAALEQLRSALEWLRTIEDARASRDADHA